MSLFGAIFGGKKHYEYKLKKEAIKYGQVINANEEVIETLSDILLAKAGVDSNSDANARVASVNSSWAGATSQMTSSIGTTISSILNPLSYGSSGGSTGIVTADGQFIPTGTNNEAIILIGLGVLAILLIKK